VEQTVGVIRHHGIGVLVTKDGGAEGGVPEKLEAARLAGCEVVVVARPQEQAPADHVFSDIRALVDACVKLEG
jgi:precorrin-6x reductase